MIKSVENGLTTMELEYFRFLLLGLSLELLAFLVDDFLDAEFNLALLDAPMLGCVLSAMYSIYNVL